MKSMKKGYSFKKTVSKAVVAFVIFSVPVLLEILPSEVLNLTIGGLLVGALNAVKHRK